MLRLPISPVQNDRHFQDDIFKWFFMNEKLCILIPISLKFAPEGLIGCDNGLAPNRWQAIIWTNTVPIHWRIYAALGRGEFMGSFQLGHWDKNEFHGNSNTCNCACAVYGLLLQNYSGLFLIPAYLRHLNHCSLEYGRCPNILKFYPYLQSFTRISFFFVKLISGWYWGSHSKTDSSDGSEPSGNRPLSEKPQTVMRWIELTRSGCEWPYALQPETWSVDCIGLLWWCDYTWH